VGAPDDFAAARLAVKAVLDFGLCGPDGSAGVAVVGHRVVHGGAEFQDSVLIDSKVKAGIAGLSKLAPLHNPAVLKAVEAVEGLLPGVPQVAVFDTAFFAHLPPKAYLYALPYDYYERWGIRRFGFHGLSHAYCAARAAEMLGRDLSGLRLINCHLGGGCSAAAVRSGMAVATTLGFSPLEGLMMGTRSGSVDPGILLYLQREHGLTVEELDHALNYSSGLLGISGVSSDLAQVEIAAAQGKQRARLAFDMFADRVRSAIGALAATLGGVDALIFTDRVGEHSAALRAAACEGLEFMGLRLDPARNAAAQPDADVAKPDSPARIFVIHTQEELAVARETRRVAAAFVPDDGKTVT
jgi:acetate kinase